jgi:ketosteroid isomerase-like protein
MYMGLMSLYYGPNTGEFSVVTAVKEGKAEYREADDKNAGGGQCVVNLDFAAEQVNLHTIGDCGFGMNVQAEGPFVRVM